MIHLQYINPLDRKFNAVFKTSFLASLQCGRQGTFVKTKIGQDPIINTLLILLLLVVHNDTVKRMATRGISYVYGHPTELQLYYSTCTRRTVPYLKVLKFSTSTSTSTKFSTSLYIEVLNLVPGTSTAVASCVLNLVDLSKNLDLPGNYPGTVQL